MIRRRLKAPSIEDIRKDLKRVEDMTETAMTLSEFIEKNGDQRWADSLINDLGPWLMIQLADLADIMETVRK